MTVYEVRPAVKINVYERGQKAVYQEEGARAVVEVLDRTMEGAIEKYRLRVVEPLNHSRVDYVPVPGADMRALEAASGRRGYNKGQELEVSRNLAAAGEMYWGMWTLTDRVEPVPDVPGCLTLTDIVGDTPKNVN